MRNLRGASVVVTGASSDVGPTFRRPPDRRSPTGNLFRPTAEGRAIEGGWRSPAAWAMVTAGLAIAAGLAALLLAPRAAR